MPTFIEGLGQNAVTTGASNLLGMTLGRLNEAHNDRRQIKQQQKLTDMQLRANQSLMEQNYYNQYEMWKKTNYPAQVQMLEAAGLNPALMYGMGGGGGTTTGSGGASVGGATAPSGGGEALGIMGMMMQNQLTKAQIKNIEADTAKKQAEAAKTQGVDTKNIEADTENKILQSVLLKYTGLEQKDLYERVTSPARGVQAKTYQDELEARQGVAGTIYELWTEGKLKDKSVAEIQNILLDNAEKEQNVEKRRAEIKEIYKKMDMLDENIKGAKLDNIIKDLEAQMQTKTGIDHNAPTWLKILGRLFTQLF